MLCETQSKPLNDAASHAQDAPRRRPHPQPPGRSPWTSEGELVCLTGVSGAGKSCLALDTLYAEGQRRFVESFSPYARQFLERLERPPMDSLEPVAAASRSIAARR